MRRSKSFSESFHQLTLDTSKKNRNSYNQHFQHINQRNILENTSEENTHESVGISSRNSSRTPFISPEAMKLAKEALLIDPLKRNDAQIESICYIFIELYLLEHLSYEHKLLASKIARISKYNPNTQIVSKNQQFEFFYVVLYGSLIFTSENNSVTFLPGDYFGALPYIDSDNNSLNPSINTPLNNHPINIPGFNPLNHIHSLNSNASPISTLTSHDTPFYDANTVTNLLPNSNQYIHNNSCPGTISTLNDFCELLIINITEFDNLIKSSEFFDVSDEQDGSSIEATYSDNILTSATIDKIIETLLDEKYYIDEPCFTQDFFLTYPIYINDISILVNKIQEILDKDPHNQRVIAVLLTWLEVCPQVFSTPAMTVFINNTCLKLKTNCCSLSYAIIETCFLKSPAFEIRFYINPDDDVPVRLKYRSVPESQTKNKLEIYVTNIDSFINYKSCELKLYDEIIFLNDMNVKDLKICQVRAKIKCISNFILIVKRCPIS